MTPFAGLFVGRLGLPDVDGRRMSVFLRCGIELFDHLDAAAVLMI
jgi:hypothetical protein